MCSDPLLDPALDHRLTDKLPPAQKSRDPLMEMAAIVAGRTPLGLIEPTMSEAEEPPNDGTHDIPANLELEIAELNLLEAFREREKDVANLHSIRLF